MLSKVTSSRAIRKGSGSPVPKELQELQKLLQNPHLENLPQDDPDVRKLVRVKNLEVEPSATAAELREKLWKIGGSLEEVLKAVSEVREKFPEGLGGR